MSDKADLLHAGLVEVSPSNRLEKSSTLRRLAAVVSFYRRLPVRYADRAYCRRHVLPAACLEGSARRRQGLRCKHIGHRDPLPPGGQKRPRHFRLPLGVDRKRKLLEREDAL